MNHIGEKEEDDKNNNINNNNDNNNNKLIAELEQNISNGEKGFYKQQ